MILFTKAGAETCKEIKGKFKFPCIECVRLADYLVEQRLKNRYIYSFFWII